MLLNVHTMQKLCQNYAKNMQDILDIRKMFARYMQKYAKCANKYAQCAKKNA